MDQPVNENEAIKLRSQYLRGTLEQSLNESITGALQADDAQICKFHGFYQQDDRDIRQQRQQQLLEPYYSFMLRARLPGGVCTGQQWLAIDSISQKLGNGSIRLTTRQTFQYHGILKQNLKPLIREINNAMIDSIGGCGDINRNVMLNPNPDQSKLHRQVYPWAQKISEQLLPSSRAYHEIWLDGEKQQLDDDTAEQEPLYGASYLPRKFKTAIAIPPENDVDVYTNDMGFIAVAENGRLTGFNVLAGGGMGTTHGDTTTYPRLADELGFIALDHVVAVSKAIIAVQRDEGNRISRRHARLKYTIDRLGLDVFKQQVEKRACVRFLPSRKIQFTRQNDRFGWRKNSNDEWNLTLFIENGRVVDDEKNKIMSGLRAIAKIHRGEFRITPNQNLTIAGIDDRLKAEIEALIDDYQLIDPRWSASRLSSIACVALPTCPQAMSEAERYFPYLMESIEDLLAKHQLSYLDTVIRMTGCPNGCARPFVAEIGLVGKAPGRYNLFLGGDGIGQRINKLYRENLNEEQILQQLDQLFASFAVHRIENESLGDFVIRKKIVTEVINPKVDFHA